MSDTRHIGDDGLTYNDEGFFVHTGLSPLHEDADVDPDAPDQPE